MAILHVPFESGNRWVAQNKSCFVTSLPRENILLLRTVQPRRWLRLADGRRSERSALTQHPFGLSNTSVRTKWLMGLAATVVLASLAVEQAVGALGLQQRVMLFGVLLLDAAAALRRGLLRRRGLAVLHECPPDGLARVTHVDRLAHDRINASAERLGVMGLLAGDPVRCSMLDGIMSGLTAVYAACTSTAGTVSRVPWRTIASAIHRPVCWLSRIVCASSTRHRPSRPGKGVFRFVALVRRQIVFRWHGVVLCTRSG